MSSNSLYDALARSQRMLLLYSRLIFANTDCVHSCCWWNFGRKLVASFLGNVLRPGSTKA